MAPLTEDWDLSKAKCGAQVVTFRKALAPSTGANAALALRVRASLILYPGSFIDLPLLLALLIGRKLVFLQVMIKSF